MRIENLKDQPIAESIIMRPSYRQETLFIPSSKPSDQFLPLNLPYLERVVIAPANDAIAPKLETCDDVIVVSLERLGVFQRPSAPIHLDLMLPHVGAFPFGRHEWERRKRRMRSGRR